MSRFGPAIPAMRDAAARRQGFGWDGLSQVSAVGAERAREDFPMASSSFRSKASSAKAGNTGHGLENRRSSVMNTLTQTVGDRRAKCLGGRPTVMTSQAPAARHVPRGAGEYGR